MAKSKKGRRHVIVARAPRRRRVSARRTPLSAGLIFPEAMVKRTKRSGSVKWHRPRVRKVGGSFKHAPRSRFFGMGPVQVNPRRRRNGVLTMRHNPVMIKYPRRGRGRRRHNPFNIKNTIRQVTNKRWLITLGTIGGGLAAGMAGKAMILQALPANMKQYSRYVGVAHIVLGAVLVGMMKKKVLKEVGVVVAATGLYDLIATNVPVLGLPSLPSYAIPGLPAKLSGSYPVSHAPVSQVAAMSGNYSVPARAGYAGSYSAPGMSTQGFSGVDNPYDGIDW